MYLDSFVNEIFLGDVGMCRLRRIDSESKLPKQVCFSYLSNNQTSQKTKKRSPDEKQPQTRSYFSTGDANLNDQYVM